jgi:putative iron-regulated protein
MTREVVRQFATNMRQGFLDSYQLALTLETDVHAFVDAPSAAGLETARNDWLAIRPPYDQAEVTRFSGSPVDELEERLNGWPLDENYIDYTIGNPTHGIINNPYDYPKIDMALLARLEGEGSGENLSTGFHAVEFMLWGQRGDQSEGPGTRPYTDFVTGPNGTAANQDRRRAYLKAASDLLVADLIEVVHGWNLDDPKSYAAKQIAGDPTQALTAIAKGMLFMAGTELLYERMSDPYITRDPKDEESCFSESTYVDIVNNALGVENTYFGRYGSLQGKGITDLVKQIDPALDAKIARDFDTARAAIAAIPQPFDHSCIAPDGSPPRMAVKAAIDAYSTLVTDLSTMSDRLGLRANFHQ